MAKIQAIIQSKNYETTVSSDSGHQLIADEPENNGGSNHGPTPKELVAASLASCTAITLKMYCNLKNWNIENIRVEVSTDPKGRNIFSRSIIVHAELNPDQKKRLLQIANHSPVHKLLAGQIEINSTIQ